MRLATISSLLAKLATQIYEKLLYAYPGDFRARYAAGMERMFAEQVQDAREHARSTPVALIVLVVRESWGVLLTAPVQRFRTCGARTLGAGGHRGGVRFVVGVVWGDLRHAVRSLARMPGFALTVILQLGLGIGAATTMLSAVDNVLLRGLPYPRADELVVFGNPGHSYALYNDWRDRTSSFSEVAAVWSDGRGFGISQSGDPEAVPGARVSREFFGMFGATPLFGRLLTDSDYEAAPARVAVVSQTLWQRRWGGTWRNDVTIRVDGIPVEVVGVLAPSFEVPDELVGSGIDVWQPLVLRPEVAQDRNWNALRVVARRRSDVALETAQADVRALARILATQYPVTDRLHDGSPRLYRLIPLFDAIVGHVQRPLYMLLGAVGMMLLIACANVLNLFLARETRRTGELALRAALGAGRGRIFAQLLSESLVLALAGGMVGVMLAFLGVRAFEVIHPGGFPRMQDIVVDTRVLLLSLGVTFTCGTLIVFPTVIASCRSGIGAALKTPESVVTDPQRPLFIRKLLIVVEFATGLMLLVGAGLLLQSFVRLRNADGGFEPNEVTSLTLQLGDRFSEQQRLQFARELVTQITALPGVELAAAGATLPPYNQGRCCWFQDVHRESSDRDAAFSILHPITPAYFEVLGARMLRGREFTNSDNILGYTPAIINETLAGILFGRSDPLGKSISVAGERWIVVGVVNDIRHWGPHIESGANVYVPHAKFGGPFTSLQAAVKSSLDPGQLAPALRETVRHIDPELPVSAITPLQHNLASSLAEPRFLSIFMATFASLAVLLAAGGIYGFFTFVVHQHHREFGIRIALGARGYSLVGVVLRSVLFLALFGSLLGLAGAVVLSRLLRSALYGVSPTDPAAFGAAATALVFTALLASFFPAFRASKTDPVKILTSKL